MLDVESATILYFMTAPLVFENITSVFEKLIKKYSTTSKVERQGKIRNWAQFHRLFTKKKPEAFLLYSLTVERDWSKIGFKRI